MPQIESKFLCAVGVGLGVAMLSSAAFWYYYRIKPNQMPKKWRRVGTLARVNLFPVKSCAAMKLEADAVVTCEGLGLRVDGIRDRVLMLIDDGARTVTARTYPKMLHITVEKAGDAQLDIKSPNMPVNLLIDLSKLAENESSLENVCTNVFGSEVKAKHCGELYDSWFSQTIQDKRDGLRLVYYYRDEPIRFTARTQPNEPSICRADTGTFGDLTSYMLMNLASVDDLNTRLKNPVDPQRFRGNFYLLMDKAEPYAEDNWSWIRIGEEAVFRAVAPCTRCILPNIDVGTAERDAEGEPLKTLKSYRMKSPNTSPVLGVQLGLRQVGNVKLNDIIYVEDKSGDNE